MDRQFQAQVGPTGRPDSPERLAGDIEAGFAQSPRAIPSMYFYDTLGAALYDEILATDEYYPPRAEAAILRRHGQDILTRAGRSELVELGAGAATRTRILLDAARDLGWDLEYTPTDASRAMLGDTVARLRGEYPRARISSVVGDYETTLGQLRARRDRIVLFLGGTIGNLTDARIARMAADVANVLAPGGHFLVGFDRPPHAGKRQELITAAYNDAKGVTARFNLNLLARLNRELGADFDLAAWGHEAVYNRDLERIESYLVSAGVQRVQIPALERSYEFAAGERILAEISRRFEPAGLGALLAPLQPVADWTDERQLFRTLLLRRP